MPRRVAAAEPHSPSAEFMKLATWNVNSIRARIEHVTDWLEQARPDVVALQELKAVEENVPVEKLESAGYQIQIAGQKAYNGVAILSRHPLESVQIGLPGNEEDAAARYIEAWVDAGAKGFRFASIYLPNGNPTDGPKFSYKLEWMEHLRAHAQGLLRHEEAVVLAGDFNVCPTDEDAHDASGMVDDALCRPETRSRFRSILNLGYTDAYRGMRPDEHEYTYWDYGRAFAQDRGLRIDHMLLSPQAADRLKDCGVDKEPRKKLKPSDHTPFWCELN